MIKSVHAHMKNTIIYKSFLLKITEINKRNARLTFMRMRDFQVRLMKSDFFCWNVHVIIKSVFATSPE